jgi:hypothetical protein
MSLIERDDYDALVRASKQLSVYERQPTEVIEREQPGYGCFSCHHSVGPMSSEKKYTTAFFYPYVSAGSYDSLAHLYPDHPPFPRFGVVISQEDKFYSAQYHFMSEKFQNWQPPTAMLTTLLNLDDESSRNMYVRQLAEYDAYGELESISHINKRIDIYEDFVEGFNDPYPGRFIIMTSSSYVRGAYLNLGAKSKAEVGVDPNDVESIYALDDMSMTDGAWQRMTNVLGLGGKVIGPRLQKLDDGKGRKSSFVHPNDYQTGSVTFTTEPNDINWNTPQASSNWSTIAVDPAEPGNS